MGAFPHGQERRSMAEREESLDHGGSYKQLEDYLYRIDGRPYPFYRDLSGQWDFREFTLLFDRIQGDAYAPPTRMMVRVPGHVAGFPEDLYKGSTTRRVALCDYLTRALGNVMKCNGQRSRDQCWSGEKGGDINVQRVGPYVMERSAVSIDDTSGTVEARMTVALPAKGRNILGKMAASLLLQKLPDYVAKGLKYSSLDSAKLYRHVEVVEDAESLRRSLRKHSLVAFVANGSVLPRKSGNSEHPLENGAAVPFCTPDRYKVTLKTPNSGEIIGMGLPVGITLIVGGGFHGKSTLLEALQTGIYNKIPGDGREFVVSDPSSVKIRAEDGRKVDSVDISPFIGVLPGGKITNCFSTENASGSTSQAANIQEALEQKCSLLLLDEDSTASNLMMRDSRIQELINRDLEPITPFSHQIKALKLAGTSTVLVVGGSGEYFHVADHVIAMKNYHASDVTDEAKNIALRYSEMSHNVGKNSGAEACSSPYPAVKPRSLLKNEFSYKIPKIKVRSLHLVDIDGQLLDLNGLEQTVEEGQTKSLALAIAIISQRVSGPWAGIPFREILELLDGELDAQGLHILSKDGMDGTLSRPRIFEIAAACNRLRNCRFTQ